MDRKHLAAFGTQLPCAEPEETQQASPQRRWSLLNHKRFFSSSFPASNVPGQQRFYFNGSGFLLTTVNSSSPADQMPQIVHTKGPIKVLWKDIEGKRSCYCFGSPGIHENNTIGKVDEELPEKSSRKQEGEGILSNEANCESKTDLVMLKVAAKTWHNTGDTRETRNALALCVEFTSTTANRIFSNLSLDERCLSASLVCKYWRDLCLDFQFWKQLDLSSRQQVTDELLEKIASRSQNIIEINISDCRSMSDTGVCVLAFKCPGLLRYTAYRCKQLSDTSIIAVASHCPLLQKVHVGNQDKLTDEGLKQLGSKCRELKDIHFGQCYKISDEGMIVIAKGCLKLQRIYMQENKLVTDQSVKAFAEHCPELQYVGFMGCSVTSKGVIHLTKLRNLSSLDLRHITELDNETVMEIVKRCKNLSSLNLCLNWIINDRCVEVIAKEGQNLRELYLVSCKITDHALIAIGRYSVTIETVDVGWCKEITDHGATLIAQSSKSLRYLGLMRCDKVNEVTVEQLVQQYPHITFSTVLQDCKRTLERAYQMGWTPNMSAASS
uniref:F-box/LRR-repeat protein 17 n=1 Tax=Myodes glareolus TaxID=447135 RepID=UPI00202074EF|nr:F-box/LRR-repeat protein 17 [Myodes glareolus]